MKSLAITFVWPLPFLLLLLPLKLQGDYWDDSEYELDTNVRDFFRELESTGPTKPPTKERIIEMIIVGEIPLEDSNYCNIELKNKEVHYKGRCYPEHYIVGASYQELSKACYGERVQCNNRVKFCRRSMDLIKGVRCVLDSGERMSNCIYKNILMTGYPIVTCQWDEDTQEFIPNYIHNMSVPE
ncbi:inactive ribonuclease-like protein 9 [Arvicanthis niloticus]|uniref:inactive ribonuclease-like protein 9 n=1 Tax=Arvicanthis niloticus TaxID=61156 RepID=UPI0014867ACF|nr:inactive ribonuclease-like protein 9 [Arvicanthis niloticus]